MEEPARRVIGLPWYSRDDYPAILEMMIDRHVLAESYGLWLMAAENNERVAQQAGLDVERVLIKPVGFGQWCRKNGLEPDSASRMKYVSEARAA